jgi:hypothetical protein
MKIVKEITAFASRLLNRKTINYRYGRFYRENTIEKNLTMYKSFANNDGNTVKQTFFKVFTFYADDLTEINIRLCQYGRFFVPDQACE